MIWVFCDLDMNIFPPHVEKKNNLRGIVYKQKHIP